MSNAPSMRIEADSLGSIPVPADRYYGAQTARSLLHFCVGEDRMPLPLIHALALVKQGAALVNRDLGALRAIEADAIVLAAEEVAAGGFDDHFPLRVWQTGSGTQTNMNVNEVIARRAGELAAEATGSPIAIHPNDHVNLSQSSNDTFSTAMHIASAIAIKSKLLPVVSSLHGALDEKARQFADVVKMGRTHLQDAIPLTVGQEMSGWAALVARNIDRIEAVLPGLYELAIGGTAVGTGLNCPPQFAEGVAAVVARLTGLPFRTHPNKFAALSAHDEIVSASAALRTLAGSLMKIANDIRWLASGPRSGLGELILPANEPGSSMMPGKVNPTQCEAVTMVAVQVYGNDAAVAFAGSQGNFELNVFKPVMIFNLLNSVRLLRDVIEGFVRFCIQGIELDHARIEAGVDRSLMLVTALVPRLGYDKAAALAGTAWEHNWSLREANSHLKLLPDEEFDRIMRPASMTHP